MLEYIIITKPAEKEGKNTIKLSNGEILQAGLARDIETLDAYLRHINWAEWYANQGPAGLKNHYYFINGAIRIERCYKDRDFIIFPLKPAPNLQGSVWYCGKAVDILYQLDKLMKKEFPETEYELKIKYQACCTIQPRIIFKKENIKQIRDTLLEFYVQDIIDKEEKEWDLQIIPPDLKYETDYSEHDDYYDCRRCDPDPNWAPLKKEKPEEDPQEKFLEQKVPKREKGNPRANCFGTKNKRPPEE